MAPDHLSENAVVLTINNEEVEIPKELLTNLNKFQSIFTDETWSQLDGKEKSHLLELLPTFPKDSQREQQDTLSEIFGGSSAFKFGNPVSSCYAKILDGQLFPEIVKEREKCRKAKLKSYKLMRKEYFRKTVQEILISRQRILDKANRHGGGFVGPMRNTRSWYKVSLDDRVRKKYQRIVRDIKQECQDDTVSSDEDEIHGSDRDVLPAFPSHYFGMHQFLMPPQTGAAGKSRPFAFPGQLPYMGVAPPNTYPYIPTGRPWDTGSQAPGLADYEYRCMLETHRKRRICNENHPELDTSDTTLADIITRANPTKKEYGKARVSPWLIGKGPKKAKTSAKDEGKPLKTKKRVRVKTKEPPPVKIKEEPKEPVRVKEEIDVMQPASRPTTPVLMADDKTTTAPATLETDNKFGCFFSLLRLILKEAPYSTCTLDQVRQRVHTFQRNDGNQVEWLRQTMDWSELAHSALKYLAGDGKATIIQDFVPMTTVTENPKEWKWSGNGYDDDDILIPLCAHWLDTVNRGEDSDSTYSESADGMQPTSDDSSLLPRDLSDQQNFIEQERKRYENPHKPYTYCLHGSLSVVGAVKGVFHKESSFSKAREHALLISNRPAYVTILSLVKDAVARLPNGEGTRAEVCRLLKDSQFINPEASDAQIHTVVSGALDRLHAERDPCVKYDITRKVWIYLHRNRTEGEFERIHQASAAAALAKKQYAQRQKSVKQKRALQDLVDQQDKSSKELASDAKGEVSTPKKTSKRPKHSAQGDSATKGEKGKAASHKEQGEKNSPASQQKAAKVANAAGVSKKDSKGSQVHRSEASQGRASEKGDRTGMLSKSPIEATKSKLAAESSKLTALGKSRDSLFGTNLKIPLPAAKAPILPQQVDVRAREPQKTKEKPKEEGTLFSTIALDAATVKLLPDIGVDKETSLPSTATSVVSTHIAIRPTTTSLNPVLNIVPPHCTATKFVRLPFSHATTITSALPTNPTSKTQPVAKYSAVHLPSPNSSVLITVPQHVDRVAPLRISLPRASIGPNISVARGIQPQSPADFTRTARPGVILSRMTTPLGPHQRIYVRQISHESLQGQPKVVNPVVTTAK